MKLEGFHAATSSGHSGFGSSMQTTEDPTKRAFPASIAVGDFIKCSMNCTPEFLETQRIPKKVTEVNTDLTIFRYQDFISVSSKTILQLKVKTVSRDLDLKCWENGLSTPANRAKADMGNNDILPGFDEDASEFLTIQLQRVGGVDNCLVLKPIGQIDTYSTHFFQRSVRRAIDAGFVNLVFLLSAVNYVSSVGIGAFVQFQKAAKEKGGRIAIAEIHPKVMEIFRLTCLDKFFVCADSLDEAVAPLKSQVPVFPKSIQCPICDKKLRVVKSGRFCCPKCKTVLSIKDSGIVSLG
jgi:anti-anti-sigma factor